MTRATRTTTFTFAAALAAAAAAGCGDPAGAARPADEAGAIRIALGAAPADAGCLRITVAGSRTVTAAFDLRAGAPATVTMGRLPIGLAQVDATAFAGPCASLPSAATPSWVTDAPQRVRIEAAIVAQVTLRLVRDGRLAIDVDFEPPPWISAQTGPIELAVIGDTPYGVPQLADFPNLVASINAEPRVSGVLHLGDIKNGSGRCDDQYNDAIRELFARFADPLVYTPGDNEWTDCHRASAGAYDPLERLAAIRRVFFPVPGLALGGGFKQVLSQAELAPSSPFVENQLWLEAQVVFAAVHAVGSNDGRLPWFGDDKTGTKADDPARRLAEVDARQAAGIAWIERAFALAQSERAAAVVLAMQADTWDASVVASGGPLDGYTATVRAIAAQARAFGKPVLLLQGDSHKFLVDRPLAAGDPIHGVTEPVPNLTRIVVEGSQANEWLRLRVDPAAATPFSWERVVR